MPHIPKNVWQPSSLSHQGSAVRPELAGTRGPQPKAPIPERRPSPANTSRLGKTRINPRTYNGPEIHPDQVYQDLFGKDAVENGRGVVPK